eukprot:TRINITY_DN14796_c0_g1_i2.p1 TRINITY_DN14796_c0_g1~~TRINITY_DN14796_c0_g1_i2.p1  ORF type:complete len:704 (-),score=169.57 TRINITY_DN14796_c0_g1_i2:263-2374(-)
MAVSDILSIVIDVTAEVFSLIGMELVMFMAAAVVYVAFVGLPNKSSKGKKLDKVSNIKEPRRVDDNRAVPAHKSAQAKKVPNSSESNVPIGITSSDKVQHDQRMLRVLQSIKILGRDGDLEAATAAFNRLRNSGAPLRPQVYNCYLDACIQCADIDRALQLFEEMKKDSFVDVVSYNTVLKVYLSCGQHEAARKLLEEMSSKGIRANKVTYNELLNAKVIAKDRVGMWQIIEEMIKGGVKASLITCSILLKSLSTASSLVEIQKVMRLIDDVDEPIDEVLFASVIDACIRCKRLPLLTEFCLRAKQKEGVSPKLNAPTYGSMVKAYGEAGDVKRVREIWADMQKNGVRPTSVTIGCVVEALVINKQGEEAWQLVKNELAQEDRAGMINTVLKGFAVGKSVNKVLAVYKDMRDNGIACNTITYNTMLDACAKCSAMDQAAPLLQDMKESDIEPDIITYSTIIKGYCLEGDIDRAFQVLQEMKSDGKFAPDEIMYNSIMDGCAKKRRVESALKLLEEMKAAGIKPTNYTLSILVKLLGHTRRLNMALQMVEDLCKQYKFKPNIQVYTCMLHACFQNKHLDRALLTHEQAVSEGCRLDEKFYAVLAKGCMQMHEPLKAIEVIRAAYKMPGSSLTPTSLKTPGMETFVLEEICSKLSSIQEASAALKELLKDLQMRGVHVHVKTNGHEAADAHRQRRADTRPWRREA